MKTTVSFFAIPKRSFEVQEHPDNDIDRLVQLYVRIGEMHVLTTYVGRDPYAVVNKAVSDAQGVVIDRLVELTKDGDAIQRNDSNS